MGITQPIIDKIKSPIDSVREYKNKEVPKMQKEADEGRTPRNLDRDIERMEKLKAFADKKFAIMCLHRNLLNRLYQKCCRKNQNQNRHLSW